ncbi:MAG TPA: GNAT family N-acetyltransferase [Candidatus Eisenbacteria bacterium]|nr:GNAT family N-acetyltransferase [Candidatus Eisenbacteria bacterium]
MMPITIRCFTYEDMPKILKLLNKDRQGSYEFRPLTNQSFRSWLQEGRLRILVGEKDGKILGSAGYNDGYWGEEISWLITLRSKEEKNTEVVLLEQIEKYVRKGMLFAALDEGSPRIEEMKQKGYKTEGGMYHMIAELRNERTIPNLPDGINIRSLRRDEEKAFVEAVNSGFQTERVKMGDIEKWKKESPPFDEEWISVAEINTKIVSVVVSKPDVWYNEHFDRKRGYLGPAATLPECRGKNLASALTVRAMNFLLAKGMDSVALYTAELNASSVSLLKKIGFEVGHHWIFVRKHFDKIGSSSSSQTIC